MRIYHVFRGVLNFKGVPFSMNIKCAVCLLMFRGKKVHNAPLNERHGFESVALRKKVFEIIGGKKLYNILNRMFLLSCVYHLATFQNFLEFFFEISYFCCGEFEASSTKGASIPSTEYKKTT